MSILVIEIIFIIISEVWWCSSSCASAPSLIWESKQNFPLLHSRFITFRHVHRFLSEISYPKIYYIYGGKGLGRVLLLILKKSVCITPILVQTTSGFIGQINFFSYVCVNITKINNTSWPVSIGTLLEKRKVRYIEVALCGVTKVGCMKINYIQIVLCGVNVKW